MLKAGPLAEPAERVRLRESVARLLARHLPADRVLVVDREGTFDRSVWTALAQVGVLGLGAAEELGGSGGSLGDSVAVTEELARVLPSLAVDYVLSGMAMRLLSEPDVGPLGSWLPEVASGQRLCAFGMSEPGAGTDLFDLRTTARLGPHGWVLNGQKAWITLADHAEAVFVLARTAAGSDGHRARGLSLVAVPTDQPGVTVRRMHLAGMRAAGSCEVFLQDAVAPPDHLVGERDRAAALLGRTLDVERVMAAALSLGIGRAALDLHVEHARSRKAFGRPIGAFQAVQHPAADSVSELSATRALIATTVTMIERGESASAYSAMAKLHAGETTARVVDRGMRAMGASGLAEESAMQMLFRDARLQLFSPVSNEMTRNILGEALGLPRSY